MNWVSIQPGLPTLSHHLTNLTGPSFDFTIIESNFVLATLSTHVCPQATVVMSSPLEFFNLVARNPTPTCPKHFQISTGINRDLSILPIYSAAFEIKGVDFTIYTHLQVPVTKPFPLELQLVLNTIKGLARFRSLSYFVIICTTLCTELTANVGVQALVADLPLWDISA